MDKFSFTNGKTYTIPPYMIDGITNYIHHRIPPGGFLTAILCNDLKNTVFQADITNMRNIPAYIYYLYNYAPHDCWGSKEKFNKWIEGE